MSEVQTYQPALPITVSSSVKDDVWHDQKGSKAFESWHFDALSDDGNQALVITFHDNYPGSPRYFNSEGAHNGDAGKRPERFPAVSIVYSVDGKIVLSAVNEFRAEQFSSVPPGVACSIAKSWFRADAVEYGSGYLVRIDLLTARKRRIVAELEWLSIESDLLESPPAGVPGAPSWNIVAPRSDVTGRITLIGRSGKTRKVAHFRGTGYHDHFRSDLPLDEMVSSRYWGRAHFVDRTAVFQCLTRQKGGDSSKLLLVNGDTMEETDTKTNTNGYVRNRFGLRMPNVLTFMTSDNVSLRISPVRVIQSGFCDVKTVSEMSLILDGEPPREGTGITNFLAPGRLKRGLIRRLSDLKIGKNGKSPLF